tara:strand:+ start:4214 stop:5542 length:1329 start_codon:yes stop_codon:yes gene_type:complete
MKALAINEPVMKDNHLQAQGFPTEVFPNEIEHIINAYNSTLNFPKEFTAASIMCCISALIGNCFNIKVKRGFSVPVHLFYIIVQERGMKKSAPMNAMIKPLYKIDKAEKDIYESKLETYKRELLAAQERKETYNEPEPKRVQMIINRTTPEALFKIHKENPKGIFQYINEAKEWFGTFNNNRNNSDEATYCQIYDGEITSKSTLKSGYVDVENPCVTILGSIQPKEISKFIIDNTENGLVDRITFDYPDYLKIVKESRDEIDQMFIDNWEKIVNRIYNYCKYSDETIGIPYSTEALNIWYDWNERNTQKINDKNNMVFQGIVKKAETNSHRYALIIEFQKYACGIIDEVKEITVSTINSAIKLSEHYIEQALKIRNTVELNKNDKSDIWFAILPENEFSTQQAYECGKNSIVNVQTRTVDKWLSNHPKLERIKKGTYKKVLI